MRQAAGQMPGPAPRIAALSAVALLLLGALAAYVIETDSLGGQFRARDDYRVDVRETGGEVIFALHRGASWLRWGPTAAREIAVLRVYEWVHGTLLWEIEASPPRPAVVAYGQVPAGFTQTVPLLGAPAPLQLGGWYAVIVQGPRGAGRSTFTPRSGPPRHP
ncbi:MAG TPA: hypothetical protein VEL75_09940 [Candidatus Methylomirabilis sp.]|nr:hypothetical protein [Candidatus Methylomirabilis sp.]